MVPVTGGVSYSSESLLIKFCFQTHIMQLFIIRCQIIQGVPKKTHDSSFLAITLLWKGLGRKVGCVLKNSGNSLSDRHQNFSI